MFLHALTRLQKETFFLKLTYILIDFILDVNKLVVFFRKMQCLIKNCINNNDFQ